MAQFKTYQPALLDRQIHALYLLKEKTGLPMTYHARLAVDHYLERLGETGREEPTEKPQAQP